MNPASGIAELLAKWEDDASALERYSDARGAAVCRLHAAELGEAIRASQDELLTIAESARESGYSEDHIRHLIANDRVPNSGKKGAPRIRRANLPIKARARSVTGPNPQAAAAAILQRRQPE